MQLLQPIYATPELQIDGVLGVKHWAKYSYIQINLFS